MFIKYTAYYAPKSESNPSKSGFKSIKEAEKYISEQSCKGCNKDLEKGFIEIGEEDDIIEIESIMQTSCGAEWFIITDKEYKEYQEEEKGFMFILNSAGYKEVKDK